MDKKTKRRGKKPALITAAGLLCLLLIVCGVYVFTYRQAVSYAQNGEFSKADACLILRPVTKRHDPRLLSLIDAGLLLEDGQYMGAENAFAALGDYRNAAAMRRETDYQWANFYLANSYLGEDSYIAAYNLFQKIPGYKDTVNAVVRLTGQLYAAGQEQYHAGDYSDAYRLLHYISQYNDVKPYLVLIDAHEHGYALSAADKDALMGLVGFEDAAELLVSTPDLAQYFLLGDWYTEDGSYCFKMEGTWSIESNLPQPDSGGGYNPFNLQNQDGVYTVHDYYSGQDTNVFRFTPLNRDIIEIYCYENDATYDLYRTNLYD